MKYDYLVVGSGLFGSIFAYEAAKRGRRIKVIDKRDHLGGNVYTKNIEGIQVHQYGAHIFHTNNKGIWDYINEFAEFNRYTNSPIANYKGEIYSLPFNMNTFNQLWGTITPDEAQSRIAEQRSAAGIGDPNNLEEQAISLVGLDIYEKLVKGYTEKQWGRKAAELPAFIIKRIPVRFTYDNNYFNDRYQGIPIGGYTQIIEKMLSSELIDLELNQDLFANKAAYLEEYPKIVYTGMIDQLFDYRYGELEYRSLRFESVTLDRQNYQGNAVVNYTDAETPYTRIIEHKHFEFGEQPKTIVTREYPQTWRKGDEPYYPLNDDGNNEKYRKYRELAEDLPNIVLGGRLGMYKYFDMHQVIAAALSLVQEEFR
ncbi:UDP-galactopyranose mutase [Paenibacillus sp. FSL P4-0081]|uniref:UDP-galactopyranose mutase n=1 Tax=Paenibacillus sp. FSL P4-0081 TaxID=1536769 RepID=UPI0004F76109|nr:UDP-galactopyranose mutase [Paenibacillus sp. FSL P4-0081]AIQ31382.1 UDP-galactopyranose mutase [Paenibacillus sp. FSL P4-0081]